jgi:hypothetical protein
MPIILRGPSRSLPNQEECRMKKRTAAVVFLASLLIGTAGFAMPEMAGQQGVKSVDETPVIAGKVVETFDSGGYTYMLLETKGAKEWVAIPELVVSVGDEVELQGGVQMGEFTSKALGRKFDQIIFSNGPTEKFNTLRKEKAHKNVDMGQPAPGSKKRGPGKIIEGLKVEKAPGENSFTLQEVMQKRSELQDKTIVVRGQVVKVSANIMGRNWVHITDASGGKWDSKLVITTKDTPEVGDVVTATGVFHNNVDFGGGYYYEIIMEDAAVK